MDKQNRPDLVAEILRQIDQVLARNRFPYVIEITETCWLWLCEELYERSWIAGHSSVTLPGADLPWPSIEPHGVAIHGLPFHVSRLDTPVYVRSAPSADEAGILQSLFGG